MSFWLILTKNIFLITLWNRNKNAQSDELPKYNLIQLKNKCIGTYSLHFTKQVLVNFSVDFSVEFKLISAMPIQIFQEKICIKEKYKVIEIIKQAEDHAHFIFGFNRSKLN